jgi:hypothetical protein
MFDRRVLSAAGFGLSLFLWACSAASKPGDPVGPAVDVAAADADAPPVSAELPSLPLAAAAAEPGGPPTRDGIYIYADCEGEGGCPFKNWRTISPTSIWQAQDPASAVVATLEPGEFVTVERVETWIVPVRGVVVKDAEGLTSGEVVYLLEYMGEGYTTIWRQGGKTEIGYDAQIDWDDQVVPDGAANKLGLWAKVKRASGERGWLFDPRFECMGQLAGDEGCRD